MRVYLGGPINGCSDEEANGWRSEVKAVLEPAGLICVDPMDRDYRGREMEPGIAAEIVELDKQDIDGCDLLLMMAPKPSFGTAMEILYGCAAAKKIITIVPDLTKTSPWVTYHSSVVTDKAAVEVAEMIVDEMKTRGMVPA